MFVSPQENELRKLLKDRIFLILCLNTFLVILAYGLNTFTRGATLIPVQILKMFFLFISICYVLIKGGIKFFNFIGIYKNIFFFSYFLFLFCLLSNEVGYSLSRALKFVVPLFYILFTIQYLGRYYAVVTIIKGILIAFLLVYSIPIITFLFTGNSLEQVNIYGDADSSAFASNHYGWASIIFILASITLVTTTQFSKKFKVFVFVLLPLSLYLLVIAANRTSWISLVLAGIYFLMRKSKIKRSYIFLGFIGVAIFVFYLSGIEGSSVNFVYEKSLNQADEGESRFNVASSMFDLFNNHKSLWLTGVGFYNHAFIKGVTNLGAYHNSYYEILFGCGLPVFLLFLYFSVWRPVYIFFTYFRSYFPVLIPILIIPFFESNFTAGQFLFFPWFIVACIGGVKFRFIRRQEVLF